MTGWTGPSGETLDFFSQRAEKTAVLLWNELCKNSGNSLVVSHGGILNAIVHAILGQPPRGGAAYGFDHCGVLRVIAHREEPGFGPHPMLRFGPGVTPGPG